MADQLAEEFEKLQLQKNESESSPKNFHLLKVIGQGGYGKVFMARRKHDATILAVKVIKKTEYDEDFMEEIKVFESIKSPFLCEMYEYFEANGKIYMILEFLSGGDLFSLMERKETFDEDSTKFYLAEIVLALEHLHDNDVIYRDLKPENVLIDKNGHVKLTDFGLAKLNFPKGSKTETKCGTLMYQAPEIIKGYPYGHEIDIWALGCLAHYMLTGELPFEGETDKETRAKILKEKIVMSEETSKACRKVLRKILRRVPERRISLVELKEMEFFESIDWNNLQAMKVPFKPELVGDDDTSQFDQSFTDLTPVVSPCKPIRNNEEKPNNNPFSGFEYQEETRQASKK